MKTDILDNRSVAVAVWLLPIAAIVASGALNIGDSWRTVVWVAALTTMGAACLANAARCGRIHCYFTGPFFIIVALLTLLYGLGVLQLGPSGWNTMGLVALVGGLLLCCVPEAFLGRYRRE